MTIASYVRAIEASLSVPFIQQSRRDYFVQRRMCIFLVYPVVSS